MFALIDAWSLKKDFQDNKRQRESLASARRLLSYLKMRVPNYLQYLVDLSPNTMQKNRAVESGRKIMIFEYPLLWVMMVSFFPKVTMTTVGRTPGSSQQWRRGFLNTYHRQCIMYVYIWATGGRAFRPLLPLLTANQNLRAWRKHHSLPVSHNPINLSQEKKGRQKNKNKSAQQNVGWMRIRTFLLLFPSSGGATFCVLSHLPSLPLPERPGAKNINLANNKMVPFLRKEQLFD